MQISLLQIWPDIEINTEDIDRKVYNLCRI